MGREADPGLRRCEKDFDSHANRLLSSELVTAGDEGLEASNMSAPGGSGDYQWKQFQGLVHASWSSPVADQETGASDEAVAVRMFM